MHLRHPLICIWILACQLLALLLLLLLHALNII